MLLALMDVAPLAHDALCCAASMLQDSPISANAINALAFAATVLQKVELTVGAQNWPLTAELLALASNLRRETQKLLRDPLVNFCGIVLSVPSVMFAASALEILHKVMNRYELPEALIDPTPLLSSILAISPKLCCHTRKTHQSHRLHHSASGSSPVEVSTINALPNFEIMQERFSNTSPKFLLVRTFVVHFCIV